MAERKLTPRTFRDGQNPFPFLTGNPSRGPAARGFDPPRPLTQNPVKKILGPGTGRFLIHQEPAHASKSRIKGYYRERYQVSSRYDRAISDNYLCPNALKTISVKPLVRLLASPDQAHMLRTTSVTKIPDRHISSKIPRRLNTWSVE